MTSSSQGRRGRFHGRARVHEGDGGAASDRARTTSAELTRVAPAALHAALSAISAAAFVVRAPGEILLANARGLALQHAEPERVAAALGDARDDALAAVCVGIDADHFLAVLPDLAQDVRARLAFVERRWALTPRQSAVLELVAEGLPNRSVAERLACSEKTVELHVSALLAKARCQGRAQLVARFWTEHG